MTQKSQFYPHAQKSRALQSGEMTLIRSRLFCLKRLRIFEDISVSLGLFQSLITKLPVKKNQTVSGDSVIIGLYLFALQSI